jgi:hypothetical protein
MMPRWITRIVALPEREVAVLRLEVPLPLRDVHRLVRLRIAIVVLVRLVRLDVQHRDVRIEQERDAVERGLPPFFARAVRK